MFGKIIKRIIIICVAISLPIHAAVSVSDGSAFVTKAEFTADLNNLSNRMAQLENSLDAKIDSLVSSYLTRNGIWNGSMQDILVGTDVGGGEYRYEGYNTSGGDRTDPRRRGQFLCFPDWWFANIAKYNLDGSDTGNPTLVYATSGDYFNYDLIFTANKSGMCNFKKLYTANDVDHRLGFLAAFNAYKEAGASGGTFGQFFPNFGSDDVFYVGSATEKKEVARINLGKVDIGKVSYFNNIRDSLSAQHFMKVYDVGMMNMLVGQQQVYFFINKGENFYSRIEFFWQCASSVMANQYQLSSDVLMFAGASDLKYIYTISATIY